MKSYAHRLCEIRVDPHSMKQAITRKHMLRRLVSASLVLLLLVASHSPARQRDARATPAQRTQSRATQAQLDAVRAYIRRSWRTLTRSNRDLAAAAADPKFRRAGTERWPVYVPPDEDLRAIESVLRAQMSASDFARVELRSLPSDAARAEAGLLY